MTGPPLRLGGEDITWADQVAPRGRKASSTRKIKPQTSNLPGAVGVGGGPSTGPTACALVSRRCVLWGLWEGVPGRGALRRCERRLSSSPLPPLAARPQGGLLGSATHVLWARVCGLGGPALSLPLACPAEGCVPRGCWEAIPGGGPSPL